MSSKLHGDPAVHKHDREVREELRARPSLGEPLLSPHTVRATLHEPRGCEESMRSAVKQVETLVRQVLDEVRKAVDVPTVHDLLDRFPGGQIISKMIERPTLPPVTFEPRPVVYSPPPVPVARPVATTPDPVRVEPPPSEKVVRRTSRPPAAKPPVPAGTRVRVMKGAFKGWTGPLQWSPAKNAYNVRLTGPDGQQTRTTLSPSRLGTSWEIESTTAPSPRAAKQKRMKAQA